VAAGLCHRVLVQLSYAIGVSYPLSVFVDSYGTSSRSGKTDAELTEIVKNNFDLRPGALIRDLNLRRLDRWKWPTLMCRIPRVAPVHVAHVC
jgi:S-adenosylmethionine synthetase